MIHHRERGRVDQRGTYWRISDHDRSLDAEIRHLGVFCVSPVLWDETKPAISRRNSRSVAAVGRERPDDEVVVGEDWPLRLPLVLEANDA